MNLPKSISRSVATITALTQSHKMKRFVSLKPHKYRRFENVLLGSLACCLSCKVLSLTTKLSTFFVRIGVIILLEYLRNQQKVIKNSSKY